MAIQLSRTRKFLNSSNTFGKTTVSTEPVKSSIFTNIMRSPFLIATKKGDRMMFVKIEDFTGSVDTVVFPKVFEEFKNFLVLDNCIAMKGKVSKRNGETSFIVEKVKAL